MTLVLVKEPDNEPVVVDIELDLKNQQKIVEGYIEVTAVNQDIILVLNEEGKLLNLPYNFDLDKSGSDYVVGTCFFMSSDETDITIEQVDLIKSLYNF